jgi:hypothetical protein
VAANFIANELSVTEDEAARDIVALGHAVISKPSQADNVLS